MADKKTPEKINRVENGDNSSSSAEDAITLIPGVSLLKSSMH